MGKVRIAFESEGLTLPISRLLPTRMVNKRLHDQPKYHRILTSIKILGMIEPPMVYPQDGPEGNYLLLDGHSRVRAMEELGETEVFCLIATDDEAFTYNHKVNQLAPIQEHFMILKALKHGVSEDRIAMTLNVDIARIRQKRDLLRGICPEAVELLKTKHATSASIRELRRVKPMRQIEMAELIVASRNFSKTYAQCLVVATPKDQLVDPRNPKPLNGLAVEDMARIQRELQSISQDFRLVEEAHGRNVLNLVISAGYLKRLLDNARVVKYLSRRHHDILTQFQQIVEDTSLDEKP